mgnify:FL=1
MIRNFLYIFVFLGLALPVQAQQMDVTFRYIPSGSVHEVTLPGIFNGWTIGSSTAMTYDLGLDQWLRSQTFNVGNRVEYKFHVKDTPTHGGYWLTDPNNPVSNASDNNNSVLDVTDPLIFQSAEQTNSSGLVTHFSAGVFTAGTITSLTYRIAGGAEQDGLSFRDPQTGVLWIPLDQPVVSGTFFSVTLVSSSGTQTVSIGNSVEPISWKTEARKTTQSTAQLRASIVRTNGTVDPSVTSALLLRNGESVGSLSVNDGVIDETILLEEGENPFVIQAMVDGVEHTSSEVVIVRRPDPAEDRWFTYSVVDNGWDPAVNGTSFSVSLQETNVSPGIASLEWIEDEALSTEVVRNVSKAGLSYAGVMGGGEVYVDGIATSSSGSSQKGRIALSLLNSSSSVRMAGDVETAAWIPGAIVYEVFPLSFGSTANGTSEAPGDRINQITANLPYIKDMGYNTIWFMPIMQNLSLTGLSGGYNILDFWNVDFRLGTNDDFKRLVESAHELDIRVILDFTINHVSPEHKWVESLRTDGDYSDYIQTSANSHSSGMDGLGASLPEQWEENALYRAYDGFGGLANLNYESADLQADIHEVIAWWLTEFEVDGFRLDAYWGPWRRYGPQEFGVPLRRLIKSIRPDAWILAEIEGTGLGTQVYYSDTGSGGIDSGYDWAFSGEVSSASQYGNLSQFKNRLSNFGFWPGPNARYFRFLENHDWTRIQELFASNPDRIKPLTGMLLTAPGIPMIYQGQEVGFGAGIGDTRRLPVSWNNPRNKEWARLHRFLAHARQASPAFGTQDISYLDTPSDVLGYVRPWPNKNAVVLINFSDQPKQVMVDPSNTVLMDHDGPIPYTNLSADTTGFHVGGFTATISGYETLIYITDEDTQLQLGALPALPFGAVYTGSESARDLPESLELMQNYPNPFNPTTFISFRLNQPAQVRLSVHDVLGREVRLLVDGFRSPGQYEVKFDGTGLASGSYLYRLETPNGTLTRNMIILK